MNFLSKLLRNQFGFSMAQALIGMGLIGGLSLVVAQIGKQASQSQKAASSSYSVVEATGQIQSFLTKEIACVNSFSGTVIPEGGSGTITRLINPDATHRVDKHFIVGEDIINKELKIKSMTLKRNAENSILTVTFIKNAAANKSAATSVSISREFIINATWDVSNRITSCASDLSNFIDTVAELALLKACPVIPSDSKRRFLPDDPAAPTTCQALVQLTDPSNDYRCPPGELYQGFEWSNGRYKKICKQAMNVGNCTEQQLLQMKPGGGFRCVDVSCPPNAIALGMDSNGQMQCLRCNAGEIPVSKGAAGFECVIPVCPNNTTIFTGFQANGQPSCQPFIDPGTCGSGGGRLVQGNDGKLKIECCSAVCNSGASYCSGSPYPSSNGCGTCVGTAVANCGAATASDYCAGTNFMSPNGCGQCAGTKLPSCVDSENYCSGETYGSANGCGDCTGTRQPIDETSTWNETTTYRAKPLAACLGGQVVRQRLRNKVCNGDAACGGASCVAESQWVDDGTQACAAACSEGATRSGALISRTSNTTYCAPYSGDKFQYISEKCVGGVWTQQAGQTCHLHTQEACDPPKKMPPSESVLYCGSANPCSPILSAYMHVSNVNGTFNFCNFTMAGGGGCFVAGTQVTLLTGEKKNIEDIVVGDELLDGSHKKATVQKLLVLDHSGDIVSINGGGYFFTPNHPFLTTNGWKSLDPVASNLETPGLNVVLLKVGDILIKRSGIELVMTLDRISTNEKVYNFELDGSHEYIADEYVVHNKIIAPEEPTEPGYP